MHKIQCERALAALKSALREMRVAERSMKGLQAANQNGLSFDVVLKSATNNQPMETALSFQVAIELVFAIIKSQILFALPEVHLEQQQINSLPKSVSRSSTEIIAESSQEYKIMFNVFRLIKVTFKQ